MSNTPQTSIVSLTNCGYQLGEKLSRHLNAQHLHKPQPFTETLRDLYRAGQRLIFISATGIAMRTLAPVLHTKYSDPPVLVLDEKGQFVIPLLSGHEGGANEWARQVAHVLKAHCVITSAQRYTHPVYTMGIGCDRGCPEAEITRLVERTLQDHPDSPGIDAIKHVASIDVKTDEPGLLAFARRFTTPVHFYPTAHLLRYSARLSEKSQHVFDAVGCYGVAEAAHWRRLRHYLAVRQNF